MLPVKKAFYPFFIDEFKLPSCLVKNPCGADPVSEQITHAGYSPAALFCGIENTASALPVEARIFLAVMPPIPGIMPRAIL